MKPKTYDLDISLKDINVDYHDQTVAGTKVGAAQIFWARLPDYMKDEWRPEILQHYIQVGLIIKEE